MIPLIPLANHLWQSTLFAAIIALLTLALRYNPARTRHALWMIAGVKFLIPFSLLTTLAGQIEWTHAAAAAQPHFAVSAITGIRQPFTADPITPPTPQTPQLWPALALMLWALGSAAILFSWIGRYLRVRTALRHSSPAPIAAPVKILSTPALVEPGVFGILRPVLLLPDGVATHLSAPQLDAIIEHELCHIRHRDNLSSSIHMLIQALFWFHPLVWWIGARLVKEREQGCDEEVLLCGRDPQVYPESILKVCQFYLESPRPCVAGITGADLKRRIELIMTQAAARKLGLTQKLLLGFTAIAIATIPIILAQSPAEHLEFEAASIKPNLFGERGFSEDEHGSRITTTNSSLQNLIKTAYGLKNYQLSGAPGWLDTYRFDIAAKAPDHTSRPQLRFMFQSLLVDRFKLAFHHQTKILPGYALVVAKSGPKLTPSTSVGTHTKGSRGQLTVQRYSLPQLAGSLAHSLDQPVVDATALNGFYDFELRWNPNEADDPAAGPSIFTALQEQLGLKLESRKVPAEIFVIDHIERSPTEN